MDGTFLVDIHLYMYTKQIAKKKNSENQPKGNIAITDVSTRCSSPPQGNNE